MMTTGVMTYDSLQEDVKNYCERPNDARLAAQLPALIALAENECATALKTLGFQSVVEAALTLGDETLAKPAFWRETISFTIVTPTAGRRTLGKRSLEYVKNFWPDAGQQGVPRFYAEYNFKNFIIAPTPDAAYAIQLAYYARLDPLSSSNQVSWLTENAPQLLLTSTMYHAHLFLKNYEMAQQWRGFFDTAKAEFTNEDAARKADRGTLVS